MRATNPIAAVAARPGGERRCSLPARLCHGLLLLLLAAAGGLITPRPAAADSTTYSSSQRQFKVGVLLLDSTIVRTNARTIAMGPENPDPYVFYIADSRSDVKPQGWEFINPLAPGTVTANIKARWDARMGNVNQTSGYSIGQKITKNMAPYWEVSLSDTSIQDLLQFDMLFITNHRTMVFSPADREKLRKLVDAGGIVWLEDCGGMRIDGTGPFFLDNLQFDGTGIGAAGTPVVKDPAHPILNTPYQLSYEEIAKLGDKNYGGYSLVRLDGGAGDPNPETLENVVGNISKGGRPYIAAGNYGSGTVVATAGDSGCDINDYAGGTNMGSGGNSGSFSGPNLLTAHVEDLKFLYNIVAYGSANNTFRRNNRRTASSFDSVGAPLVTGFNFQNTLTVQQRPDDIVDSRSAPVIAKGIAFISGRNRNGRVTIRAYDLNPYSDLDGDGNFDEGIPDVSLGLPYDEIWRYDDATTIPAGTYPSAPVFATVPNAGGYSDKLFVARPDGALVVLPALQRAGGSFDPAPSPEIVPPDKSGGSYTLMPRGVAPSPVLFEGKIYQVEPSGLVRCLNAASPSGTQLWATFQNAPYKIEPTGSPVLGLSRQASDTNFLARNSGGTTNDVMLYVPCRVADPNKNNGVPFAQIMAYWLGTRNEAIRPGNVESRDNIANFKTRVAGGAAGGPAVGQYLIAPFTPTAVRVFASDKSNNSSAQQNYAQGNDVSRLYAVTGTVIPIASDGTFQLKTPTNTNLADPTQPDADILISVDYDVLYLSTFGTPPSYGSNPTQVGARPNRILDTVNSFFTGANAFITDQTFTTPGFSPNDGLLFAAEQVPTGQNAGNFPTIFAINEQEGDNLTPTNSRIRWRFPIFNDLNPTVQSSGRLTRTVENDTVDDIVPLVNYLRFDPGWPDTSVARQLASPEPLRGVRLTGSPIVTNDGVAYFLGRATAPASVPGRTLTVLLAFKTDPDIVLTLPEPFDTAAGVTLLQSDLLSATSANTPPGVVRASTNQPNGQQFILDGDRGRITILNFRASSGGFSASQSFVVKYRPKNSGQERRVVIPPVPQGNAGTFGASVDATGRITQNSGGFTPLLWYYVLPGVPRSQPTLIGDYIYYVAQLSGSRSSVIAVDARPTSLDASVRVGFSEPVGNVVNQIITPTSNTPQPTKINHVRMVQDISAPGFPTPLPEAPPVGGDGSLVVNTSRGTFDLQTGVTLVADSKHVLEVGADASALWTLDSTVENSVVGGQLPIYSGIGTVLNANVATGRTNIKRLGLARPTVARRIGTSDYLIADTGNNRVLRVDRSGQILWSLTRLSDRFRVLAGGETTTLSQPTDVQFYTTSTLNGSGAVTGYEIHYLIADAGNFRIVEVADYYDSSGNPLNPGEHNVVWVTRTSPGQGRNLRYQSIQRYLGFGPAGTPYAGLFGYPYVSAVVSNSNAGTGGQADFAGGALVSLNYSPYNTTVLLRNGITANAATNPVILWPAAGAGNAASTTEPTGNGTLLASFTEINIGTGGGKWTPKKLNNPVFFQQLNLSPNRVITTPRTLFLICDADGAYVVQNRTRNGTTVRDVLWQFTQADYDAMNAARLNLAAGGVQAGDLPRFTPTSIQVLSSGNYLITNSHAGRNPLFASGQFNGEAFEVNPGTGALLLSIANFNVTLRGGTFENFSVPRLVNETLPGQPIRLRQVMGNPDNTTGLVEQPLSAVRP